MGNSSVKNNGIKKHIKKKNLESSGPSYDLKIDKLHLAIAIILIVAAFIIVLLSFWHAQGHTNASSTTTLQNQSVQKVSRSLFINGINKFNETKNIEVSYTLNMSGEYGFKIPVLINLYKLFNNTKIDLKIPSVNYEIAIYSENNKEVTCDISNLSNAACNISKINYYKKIMLFGKNVSFLDNMSIDYINKSTILGNSCSDFNIMIPNNIMKNISGLSSEIQPAYPQQSDLTYTENICLNKTYGFPAYINLLQSANFGNETTSIFSMTATNNSVGMVNNSEFLLPVPFLVKSDAYCNSSGITLNFTPLINLSNPKLIINISNYNYNKSIEVNKILKGNYISFGNYSININLTSDKGMEPNYLDVCRDNYCAQSVCYAP